MYIEPVIMIVNVVLYSYVQYVGFSSNLSCNITYMLYLTIDTPYYSSKLKNLMTVLVGGIISQEQFIYRHNNIQINVIWVSHEHSSPSILRAYYHSWKSLKFLWLFPRIFVNALHCLWICCKTSSTSFLLDLVACLPDSEGTLNCSSIRTHYWNRHFYSYT